MDKDDIVETPARNGTDPTSSASTDPAADEADDAGAAAEAGALDDAGMAPGAPDVSSEFLSELTEAMMGVVGKERDRIGAIVEADAAGHLVEAKERAATEAEAFRQIADEDVANIEAWADAEVERIRGDAASRIADRRADLDTALAQQEAVLDNELKGIETAVADYDVTLQSYLDDLRSTGDPAEIAERAHSLPTPPALDDVRAVARAEALTRIAEEAAAAGAPAVDADASADDATDIDDDAAAVAGGSDGAVVADEPSADAAASRRPTTATVTRRRAPRARTAARHRPTRAAAIGAIPGAGRRRLGGPHRLGGRRRSRGAHRSAGQSDGYRLERGERAGRGHGSGGHGGPRLGDRGRGVRPDRRRHGRAQRRRSSERRGATHPLRRAVDGPDPSGGPHGHEPRLTERRAAGGPGVWGRPAT